MNDKINNNNQLAIAIMDKVMARWMIKCFGSNATDRDGSHNN
jgi:hypothetical protein